jgi:hypothetical protein
LWNTRWQVDGYLGAVPDATRADLEGRFVLGSGVRGVKRQAHIRRAELGGAPRGAGTIALVNTIALYEGWLAALSRSFPGVKSNELHFPSKGVRGRTERGVREALIDMTKTTSAAMQTGFAPVLRAKPHYRGKELDELFLVYRYFKELRNTLVHSGGVATQRLVDATYSSPKKLIR